MCVFLLSKTLVYNLYTLYFFILLSNFFHILQWIVVILKRKGRFDLFCKGQDWVRRRLLPVYLDLFSICCTVKSVIFMDIFTIKWLIFQSWFLDYFMWLKFENNLLLFENHFPNLKFLLRIFDDGEDNFKNLICNLVFKTIYHTKNVEMFQFFSRRNQNKWFSQSFLVRLCCNFRLIGLFGHNMI